MFLITKRPYPGTMSLVDAVKEQSEKLRKDKIGKITTARPLLTFGGFGVSLFVSVPPRHARECRRKIHGLRRMLDLGMKTHEIGHSVFWPRLDCGDNNNNVCEEILQEELIALVYVKFRVSSETDMSLPEMRASLGDYLKKVSGSDGIAAEVKYSWMAGFGWADVILVLGGKNTEQLLNAAFAIRVHWTVHRTGSFLYADPGIKRFPGDCYGPC